jgi:hypothetical protein
MANGLPSLIRLHRWRVDEQRRRLAELIRRSDDLYGEAQRLEREIADEQARSRTDPLEAGTAYAAYARAAIERRTRTAATTSAKPTGRCGPWKRPRPSANSAKRWKRSAANGSSSTKSASRPTAAEPISQPVDSKGKFATAMAGGEYPTGARGQ